MEIKIPKEVREYHETIFFGLNTRQFVCSLLAVGVAVAVYFLLQPMLDTEEIGWVCILACRTVCRLRIFYLPRHDAGATAVGMVQIRTAVPQTAGVPLG